MLCGEVWLVELPQPSGAPGHEQFGTRPAVIAQNDIITTNLSTVLIVPITGNRRVSFEGSFWIDPSPANGLDRPSTALTHQLRAIDKGRFRRMIGKLEDKYLKILEDEITGLLGFPW